MRDYAALVAFIEGRARTPFAWGREANDCVSFALGTVQAATGRNLDLPDWTDEASGLAAIEAEGGIVAAVGKRLSEIPPAMAQRGDIALVNSGNMPVLMVVEGETLIGPGEDGQLRQPRSAAIKAWSAG